MMMLLRKKGPSTEGVFRKPCNSKNMREIREQLNSGLEVDMEAQPTVLLVGLLKVSGNHIILKKVPIKIQPHHHLSLVTEFSEGTSWQPAGI